MLLMSTMLHAETVRIYAAASLTNAITDIARLYEKQHADLPIVPVFASSAILAKQIAAGASSDLFFSADTDWMQDLVKNKKYRPLRFSLFCLMNWC
jgi:molybdate transport system substrate-binding protein